jgi:hypothetical protein
MKRTNKMIPYTRELDKFCKVGMAQHLATHRLSAHGALVDGDFIGAGIDVDDTGREAISEARCEMWWYRIRFVQNNVR